MDISTRLSSSKQSDTPGNHNKAHVDAPTTLAAESGSEQRCGNTHVSELSEDQKALLIVRALIFDQHDCQRTHPISEASAADRGGSAHRDGASGAESASNKAQQDGQESKLSRWRLFMREKDSEGDGTMAPHEKHDKLSSKHESEPEFHADDQDDAGSPHSWVVADKKCTFEEDLQGMRCFGLVRYPSSSKEQCSYLCCSYEPCHTWQWLETGGHGIEGCWLGLGHPEITCNAEPGSGSNFSGGRMKKLSAN
mmetsp:Transcript_9003/g.14218  ORF Transcript_9003/g.14218 Transcript_9003/m.14218 type:complete len:252 (-) Transcript_9003:953-1708(-)